MTVRKVWLGSTGPFLFDDAVPYIDPDGTMFPDNQNAIATDGQLLVNEPATAPTHVVRKADLDAVLGDVGDIDARLTTLEGQVVYLSGVVTDHDAALTSLQGRVSYLEGVAADHDARIVTLEGVAASLGTIAQQDYNAVSITGGDARFTGDMSTVGLAALQTITSGSYALNMIYYKNSQNGINLKGTVNNDGPGSPVVFTNMGDVPVGSITASGASVAYNTTSDVRLKHSITALAGALDVMLALKPVNYLWNSDNTPGYGLLAHELQQVIPDAVSGKADAISEDGSILPQQVDYSKLVPWLTAAMQELFQQVQYLNARIVELEIA